MSKLTVKIEDQLNSIFLIHEQKNNLSQINEA